MCKTTKTKNLPGKNLPGKIFNLFIYTSNLNYLCYKVWRKHCNILINKFNN